MMVLVDTSVWSLALRRSGKGLGPEQEQLRRELGELIREGRVRLIGSIRQEILSGIREEAQFRTLRMRLRAFPDEPLTTADYEGAAEADNECRHSGISGSAVDFLICAVAMRRTWAIFTTDRDFDRYRKHLAIRIHSRRLT